MVNQSKTGRWSISQRLGDGQSTGDGEMVNQLETEMVKQSETCLLYTSDAADES